MLRNRRTVAWLAALLWAGLGSSSLGQEAPDPTVDALDARVDRFFQDVSAGQAQDAFQKLLVGSQLLNQTDALKELVAQTNGLEAKYGPYRESERITARRIGKDLECEFRGIDDRSPDASRARSYRGFRFHGKATGNRIL